MDAYKILKIEKDADIDIIKQFYKKLVLETHPDHGGDQNKFIKIREAYEFLTKTIPTKEEEAYNLARLLRRAENWVKNSFGMKLFQHMEFNKYGKSLKITGDVRAGNLNFKGNIKIIGNITSPPYLKYVTKIKASDITIAGNIYNGATINCHDIYFNIIYGTERRIKDEIQVGKFTNKDLTSTINASGLVSLKESVGPAIINGKTVDVYNIQNKTVINAENVIIRGNTITHDCVINVSKSLKFINSSILGLSGDAVIKWGNKQLRLFYLKTVKPSMIPGYEKYNNLVLDNVDITIDVLETIYAKVHESVFKKIF